MNRLPLDLHFHLLGEQLRRHAGLWRPAPFHEPQPPWRARFPGLATRLLALEDAEVERLANQPHALLQLLARTHPESAALSRLIDLPRSAEPVLLQASRLAWRIPGRKQAQIEAFASAVPDLGAPLLEWCAGKGHLGRLLGAARRQPVLSLEWDAALCAEGEALADRVAVEQRFLLVNVLQAATAPLLAGRHAVALHACGDLHLTLLREAAAVRVPALDLAPCCYYRIAAPDYQPLNPDADLPLSREELHLAVTETVSAGARERRLRDRDLAWKLAFLEWRAEHTGVRGKTFKPVPAAWAGDGFTAWLARLTQREGLDAPVAPEVWEARGGQRLREVRRLDLVRLAFRRPLEIWLALDRALFLERQGYQVRLSEFCPRGVTPRNLLISARLPGAAAAARSAALPA